MPVSPHARQPAWTVARRGACVRFGVRPDAFGNALGNSLAYGSGQAGGANSGAQEDRLSSFIAMAVNGAGMDAIGPGGLHRAKWASRKKTLSFTGAVFARAAYTVDSHQENACCYGALVSEATIYGYVEAKEPLQNPGQ